MSEREPRRPFVPLGTELPPPRPGVRHVRVPLVCVIVADDRLRRRTERLFHWPMIILSLLILPLLVLDYLYFTRMVQNPDYDLQQDWVYWTAKFGFGLVWFAFVVEFMVKISIAESRLEYVRRNWLDLIIIALPVLRPLRAARLAKTGKVFTMRGVGMKFIRYVFTLVIGFEATERLLHRIGLKSLRKRKDPQHMTRHELMREVKRLRRLTDAWEDWHEAHQAFADSQRSDRKGFDLPPPSLEDDSLQSGDACRAGAAQPDGR